MIKRILHRFLLVTLVAATILCNIMVTFAEDEAKEYFDKTFRINREGLTTTFTVEAVPGSMLNVRIFYDGGKTPEFNNSDSVMENVAYVNQFDVPESGIVEFSFQNNERTGVYSLRLSGQVYTADLNIIGDNSIPQVSTGGLFARFENINYKTIHPEMNDYYVSAAVLEEWNDGADVYELARSIRSKLDQETPGRRMLCLGGSFNKYFYREGRYAENVIWFDESAQYVHDKLDMFFKAFYEVGGTVDYIYTDLEVLGGAYQASELETIASDPRYETQFRPMLEEYRFFENIDKDLSLAEAYPTSVDNMYRMGYAVRKHVTKYFDYAFYQSAAKWFPNVKYSEYGLTEVGRWDEWGLLGANNAYAGTHHTPELYLSRISQMAESDVDFKRIYHYDATNFDMLTSMQKRIYYIYPFNENAKVQPYIGSYNINVNILNSPYIAEQYFHTALYNPDPFMVFGVRITYEESGNQKFEHDLWYEDGIIMNLVKHINDVIGPSEPEDRKVIDCGEPLHYKYYLLSGMRVKDRNIYRITPDLDRESSELESLEAFLVSETNNEVKFAVNGQTVTFPQGKIIRKSPDTAVPELGYWVETPADVFPVQEYAVPGTLDGIWEANAKIFSDRWGEEADTLEKDESYTLVVRYDNQQNSSQDITVFIGEYDEDGNALSFEALGNETAAVGQQGRFLYRLPKLKPDTHSARIFIWDNFSNLAPLKPVTDILCKD